MNWVLDITMGKPYCFCPFEEPDTVVVGMSVVSGNCPGSLVGVFHADGHEKAKKWINKNPNWYAEYSKKELDI